MLLQFNCIVVISCSLSPLQQSTVTPSRVVTLKETARQHSTTATHTTKTESVCSFRLKTKCMSFTRTTQQVSLLCEQRPQQCPCNIKETWTHYLVLLWFVREITQAVGSQVPVSCSWTPCTEEISRLNQRASQTFF